MAEFKKFGGAGRGGFKRAGARPSFGQRPAFTGHIKNDDERPKYPATCSNCGNSCEVPFRPSQGKKVLCRDCFRASGSTSAERRSGGVYPKREFSAPSFQKPISQSSGNGDEVRKQLEMINAKLDKIAQFLKDTAL